MGKSWEYEEGDGLLGRGPRERQGDQGMAADQASWPEEKQAGTVSCSQAGRTWRSRSPRP